MQSVRPLFSDLFAYVSLFEQMTFDDSQPSYEQVRGEITALLEQQDAAAKRLGMLDQEYQEARFAVVAWIDETILRQSAWEGHNTWSHTPLQHEYYQTRNAGEELFARLEKLRADQKEIREIYYLCLGLGFSGQYFLGLEDELKLNQIRHEQVQHLPLPVEDMHKVKQLMPQPYEVTPPAGTPIKPPLTRRLLKVGLALLVGIPAVLFLAYLFVQPPLEDVDRPREKTVDLATTVQPWLANHQELLECANVTIESVEAQTGMVHLAGRVANPEQRAAIRKGVLSIKGVTQVNDRLVQLIPVSLPMPRLFCEVVELLEPFKNSAEERKSNLLMGLNNKEVLPQYKKNDHLIVKAQTPSAFKSYIYIDYYTADQWVGHLYPNPKESRNPFDTNHSLIVGDDNSQQQWGITEPFGLELITVIASKTPLFSVPRFAPESAASYLNVLRQVLSGFSRSDIAVTFSFIKTEDIQQP